jgi:hypothetical protein
VVVSDTAAAAQIMSLLPSGRPRAMVVTSPDQWPTLLPRDGATPPSVPLRSPATVQKADEGLTKPIADHPVMNPIRQLPTNLSHA